MDKRVVLAVAGSGKTQHIIDKLDINSRALIVTYTVNNTTNLKKRILNKFGVMPKGVRVYTYFSFLISFCVRPIVGNDMKIKGLAIVILLDLRNATLMSITSAKETDFTITVLRR